jgi:hypothetical protein
MPDSRLHDAEGRDAFFATLPRPAAPPKSTSQHMSNKPSRTLTFKCKKCSKPVQVYLQKVSACSHIQPYQGICKCGEVMRHATGQKETVESYLASADGNWAHHH